MNFRTFSSAVAPFAKTLHLKMDFNAFKSYLNMVFVASKSTFYQNDRMDKVERYKQYRYSPSVLQHKSSGFEKCTMHRTLYTYDTLSTPFLMSTLCFERRKHRVQKYFNWVS